MKQYVPIEDLQDLVPLTPANTSILQVVTDNRSSNDSISGSDGYQLPTPGPLKLLLVILLAMLILGVVVGNSLVIMSVSVFHKMRTLSNCLIGSLASADLLVAITVLPISLQYELSERWTLGVYVCELWITSDVFCCTASILNIVVIAVDRYWLITRNVRYTHSTRMPRRTVCVLLLTGAWLISALIASAPLMGWRSGRERDDPSQCVISQDYAYTVFSTFGAFWLPLAVILIVYAKIFRFAKLRSRRRYGRASSRRTAGASTSASLKSKSRMTIVKSVRAGNTNRGRDYVVDTLRHQAVKHGGAASDNVIVGDNVASVCDGGTVDVVESVLKSNRLLQVPPTGYTAPYHRESNASRIRLSVTETTAGLDSSNGSSSRTTKSSSASAASSVYLNPGENPTADSSSIVVHHQPSGSTSSNNPNLSDSPTTYAVSGAPTPPTTGAGGRRKCRARRMRRSARTLGLVIGGFVVCWLPFFVIATVRPFCPHCHVPNALNSIVLWLGYCNSLFNPAIYAIWDQSFRRSFKRICFCGALR